MSLLKAVSFLGGMGLKKRECGFSNITIWKLYIIIILPVPLFLSSSLFIHSPLAWFFLCILKPPIGFAGLVGWGRRLCCGTNCCDQSLDTIRIVLFPTSSRFHHRSSYLLSLFIFASLLSCLFFFGRYVLLISRMDRLMEPINSMQASLCWGSDGSMGLDVSRRDGAAVEEIHKWWRCFEAAFCVLGRLDFVWYNTRFPLPDGLSSTRFSFLSWQAEVKKRSAETKISELNERAGR